MEGEHRFRNGYVSSSNPRKMVRQWAEKEFRNLKRMFMSGLRGPVPVEIRGHIFVMSMIGEDDVTPAPRLKDYISSSLDEWKRIYVEVIALARALYHTCKLVHGDLSEYNILYHSGHPYIIDVSQSMEGCHCHAEKFLKRDCFNVTSYFRKKLQALSAPLETDSENEDSPKESADDYHTYGGVKDIKFQGLKRTDSTDASESGGGGRLNRRKFDNNDASGEDWHFPPPSLQARLGRLTEPLSVEELYEYIMADEAVIDKYNSNVKWPAYDVEFRRSEWAHRMQCHRVRAITPVQSESEDEADDEVREEPEATIVDNLYAEETKYTLSDYLAKAEAFGRLCSKSLAHVEYVLASRSEKGPEDLEVFLQTEMPQSLFEVTKNCPAWCNHS